MQTKITKKCATLFFAVLFLMSPALAFAQSGYVDYLAVWSKNADVQAANAKYKDDMAQAVAASKAAQAPGLSDADKTDKQFQAYKLVLEANKSHSLAYAAAKKKILAAIEKVRQDKNFDMIINKAFVLAGGIDVTADVMTELGEK